MFSDTHFHLDHVARQIPDPAGMFDILVSEGCPFLLDIGTHCDDLQPRHILASTLIVATEHPAMVNNILNFSAGIWPAGEAIAARHTQIAELEKNITDTIYSTAVEKNSIQIVHPVCAVGECGMDHHWPVSDQNGEEELFAMQLDLARRLQLPVIVHSRDAFDDTLGCIINTGYHHGVIHCFSYGISEARAFLDHGWYVSFSGSVTYTKKQKKDDMDALLRFIPDDRILLETDAPYLAPVPKRGSTNSPLFVDYVYRYVAASRGIAPAVLGDTVLQNALTLFGN
jgi:TatD DNase family protein